MAWREEGDMLRKRSVPIPVALSVLAVAGVALILVSALVPQRIPAPQASRATLATILPTTTPPVPAALSQPDAQTAGRQAVRSLVQIWVSNDRPLAPDGGGSGSIVDGERGLIVTNWHVVGGYMGMLANERGYARIYLAREVDQLPEFAYWAQVLPPYSDPELDLAVLQITHRATDLAPVQSPLDLPAVPLGDSALVHTGDHVLLLGFPNYADGRLSWTEGSVVTQDDEWIKTDAEVSHGHSGGMMLNERGELIGIPTQIESTTAGGVLTLVRPINRARPLVADAIAAGPAPAAPLLSRKPSTDTLRVVLGVEYLNLWVDPSIGLRVDNVGPGTLVEVLREPIWDEEQFWYYVQVVGTRRSGWASGIYLASWEAAASPILFASDRAGAFDIYRLWPGWTGLARLTGDPGDEEHPSWSPDHTSIAFTSNRSGNFDLYVMNVNGGPWTQLTSGEANDVAPVWSPDGSRIAFASDRDGDWELFVVNADGTGLRQLTSNEAWDGFPAWSPDSTRLAYTSRRTGNDDLFLLDLANGLDQQLTTNPYADAHPAWAPHGDEIIYIAVVPGGGTLLREIGLLNVHDPVHSRHVTFIEPGEALDGYTDWSPDGQWILFTSRRDGNEEIYLLPAGGGEAVNLTQAPFSDDLTPAWSR